MDKFELLNSIGYIVAGAITYVAGSKTFEKIKQDWNIFKFRKSLDMDVEVNKVLTEIRIKYGFNRVSIIDYHNGTSSLSGFSFKYGTMTYESTDNHTKDIITTFKNIPTTIVSNMLSQLEKSSKGYVFESIRGFDEQGVITHKMFGVDTAHNFRIGSSLINGCVSCVYTSEDVRNKNLLTDDEIIDIKTYIQQILLLREKR